VTIITTTAASGLILAQSIATAAYIVAALLFILALAGCRSRRAPAAASPTASPA
jgi:NAD/NADP transhydrogenase beta subunit